MSRLDHEEEEHENHERWLVSYADFITLLFAFFVVMYAISSVDQKRAIRVENSVRWALHIAGHGGGGDRMLNPEALMPGAPSVEMIRKTDRERSSDEKLVKTVRAHIVRKVSNTGAGEARPSVLVMLEGRTLVVRVSTLNLFDEGKAVLRPSALGTLDAVLAEVGALNKPVRVEGHTDSSGASAVFDKNWALSAERAASVVAYAEAAGYIDTKLLSLAGYGARRPVAPNDTPEGRERNRRIDIVVDLAAPDVSDVVSAPAD